jgi:hypothetical protein
VICGWFKILNFCPAGEDKRAMRALPGDIRAGGSTVDRTWHPIAGTLAGPRGRAATCEAATGYACGPTPCWRSRGQPSSPSHLAVPATSWAHGPLKIAPRTRASHTGGRAAAGLYIYTGCPPMDSTPFHQLEALPSH